MNKILISLLLIGIVKISIAQPDSLQPKLDSIIQEANLLYCYEKAAWISSDIAMANKELKNSFGGYLIYHADNTIIATIMHKNQTDRIAKISFLASDMEKPSDTNLDSAKLSKFENELLKIKIKIINQLSNNKYQVGIPQGYNPNLVLIKEEVGYKLYILMGTPESGIIPFGNDYLFNADLDGNIESWKKFHSRLIPAKSTTPDGKLVISMMHSHLKTTPLITATDICTFRLYGKLCGMKEFFVYSTAFGINFKYNIDKNKIEIVDDL